MTATLDKYHIKKPWGFEEIWAECDSYVGKIIVIYPGHRLSRQYHEKKEETIRVLSGVLRLEIGRDENIEIITMHPGDRYHIVPSLVHRFCCEGIEETTLVEVSTPYLDDVIRIEDDYRR